MTDPLHLRTIKVSETDSVEIIWQFTNEPEYRQLMICPPKATRDARNQSQTLYNPTNPKHGVDCPKVPHVGSGLLHGPYDDTSYDVDGVSYCGRCHRAL